MQDFARLLEQLEKLCVVLTDVQRVAVMDDGPDIEPERRAHFVDIFTEQRLADRRLARIVQATIPLYRVSLPHGGSFRDPGAGGTMDQQHQDAHLTLLQASLADDRKQTHP